MGWAEENGAQGAGQCLCLPDPALGTLLRPCAGDPDRAGSRSSAGARAALIQMGRVGLRGGEWSVA